MNAIVLESFHPLYKLSQTQRLLLSARGNRLRLQPGQTRTGDDGAAKQRLFLLSGIVRLITTGLPDVQPDVQIAAGSPEARKSLRLLSGQVLVGVEDSELLLLEDTELTELIMQAPKPNFTSAAGSRLLEPGTIGNDEASLGFRLISRIGVELQHQRLTLPSLPLAADRIRRAANDPECDVARIVSIVQTDPAITAKLIYAVNSPLFRSVRKIETCRDAVIRLGIQITRDLVSLFTIRELFNTKHEALRERMEQLWQHSTLVGTLASVIAERVPGVSSDQALLAGLMHDIGAIPVIHYAGEQPELRRHADLLDHLISDLREEVGLAMLQAWGFPDQVIASVKYAERYDGDANESVPLCVDIVTLAQVHACIGTPAQAGLPPMNRIPAFKRLERFEITPQNSLDIIQLARAQSGTVFEVIS